MDLTPRVRTAQLPPRLTQALSASARQVSGSARDLTLAFSVDGRRPRAAPAVTGPLSFATGDTQRAEVLAARAVAQLSPRTAVAFGYALGAEGLVTQVQGAKEPAFLIARSATSDFGLLRGGDIAAAIRRQLGPWGLTLGAESGEAISGAPVAEPLPVRRRRRHEVSRVGLSLDRRWAGVEATMGVSWLSEERTVLGARLHPALGARGADSFFLDAGGNWQFAPGWRLGAAWRHGHTVARQAGLVAAGSRLSSNGWSLDVVRSSLFARGDNLALRIAQPLRVRSGGMNLRLPVSYSYDTLEAEHAIRSLSLSPRGRELAGELAWRGPLWGGLGVVSLFFREDPGHFAGIRDDHGLAFSWNTRF